MSKLILASTSAYRKELLNRLGLPFISAAPNVDEQRHKNETAEQLVRRLSIDKATAVADKYPNALIIGSDQVAVLDDVILTKPGTEENAFNQLTACSGKTVTFLTGLCLYNSATKRQQVAIEKYDVTFNRLDKKQIWSYIKHEQPLDCAGSFKSEGLGICLFKRIHGDDPTSLIGLPLIRLTEFLHNEQVDPLLTASNVPSQG